MLRRRFHRSLIFSLAAALALPLFIWGTAPLLGGYPALALFAMLSLVAHVALVAPSMRRGVQAGLLMMLIGFFLLALFGWPRGEGTVVSFIALLTTAAVPVRAGFLHTGARARALFLESVGGFAALGLASIFLGGGLAFWAAGTWAYFLVLSVGQLVPVSARGREERAADPFERSRERLESLLARSI